MAKTYQQGCVQVIQLEDHLTQDELEALRPSVSNATQTRLPKVVLDLRRLRLIDSAGLEFLVDLQKACERQGGALKLACAGALIRDVFRVTGLDREFALHRDVVAAAGAFAQ